MNIYGTFDFINLGTGTTDTAIISKMTSLLTDDNPDPAIEHLPAKDYILKITGASLTADITWDLSEPFLDCKRRNDSRYVSC